MQHRDFVSVALFQKIILNLSVVIFLNFRLTKPDHLPDQKYEVDESDDSKSEDSLLSPSGQTIKSGFLYKTPFGSRSETIFMKVCLYAINIYRIDANQILVQATV